MATAENLLDMKLEKISRENVGGWKWEKKKLQKELQPFLDGIALGKKIMEIMNEDIDMQSIPL